MNHRLGLHWIRVHPDAEDMTHIGRMQYRSAKLFEWMWSDAHLCAGLVSAMPKDAIFLIRDHPMSEQKGDMERDPVGTGNRHADEWAAKVQEGRVHTPLHRSFFLGINEADSNYLQQQINDYNTAFLRRLEKHGLRGAAGSFSVGHPSTVGLKPDTLPDWSHYNTMHAAIVENGGILVCHEYGMPDDFGWGYWCNRIQHCPWQDVTIIIGETGIDSGVVHDRPNKGWLHYGMSPEAYAQWLDTYMARLDARVHSVMPFSYDFSKPWDTFDVRPARAAFETHNWTQTPQPKPPVVQPQPDPPWPDKPDPPLPPGPVPVDLFERCIAFVLKWEGGYANNPHDPGGETHWGISKRSYPHLDIKNLTREQAIDIYYRDYWQASGAHNMSWPLCLIHLDTAVNAGVGRAQEMLRRSDGIFLRYAGHLIDWYTRIDNFEHFGRAWIRRRADLLLEVTK